MDQTVEQVVAEGHTGRYIGWEMLSGLEFAEDVARFAEVTGNPNPAVGSIRPGDTPVWIEDAQLKPGSRQHHIWKHGGTSKRVRIP